MQRLVGKCALVTGGARGIGEGIVRRFVAEGAKVMICDVLEAEGAALAAELGAAAAFTRLDVTSADQWRAAIAATETAFGKLDTLVNNAGIIVFKRLDDLSEDEIRRVIDINLIGTMLGAQLAIPAIERAGGGSITNMSSADGISGANSLTAYCASKFGVRGFTKALAQEGAKFGVTVNALAPGYIDTDMVAAVPEDVLAKIVAKVPVGRLGQADEIARGVAFLCGEDAGFVTGSTLSINGGQHMY